MKRIIIFKIPNVEKKAPPPPQEKQRKKTHFLSCILTCVANPYYKRSSFGSM